MRLQPNTIFSRYCMRLQPNTISPKQHDTQVFAGWQKPKAKASYNIVGSHFKPSVECYFGHIVQGGSRPLAIWILQMYWGIFENPDSVLYQCYQCYYCQQYNKYLLYRQLSDMENIVQLQLSDMSQYIYNCLYLLINMICQIFDNKTIDMTSSSTLSTQVQVF